MSAASRSTSNSLEREQPCFASLIGRAQSGEAPWGATRFYRSHSLFPPPLIFASVQVVLRRLFAKLRSCGLGLEYLLWERSEVRSGCSCLPRRESHSTPELLPSLRPFGNVKSQVQNYLVEELYSGIPCDDCPGQFCCKATVTRFPAYALFQVNRLMNLQTPFPIDDVLELEDSEGEHQHRYVLQGVIVHQGDSKDYGHYVAYLRRTPSYYSPSVFLNISDEFIRTVDRETLRNEAGELDAEHQQSFCFLYKQEEEVLEFQEWNRSLDERVQDVQTRDRRTIDELQKILNRAPALRSLEVFASTISDEINPMQQTIDGLREKRRDLLQSIQEFEQDRTELEQVSARLEEQRRKNEEMRDNLKKFDEAIESRKRQLEEEGRGNELEEEGELERDDDDDPLVEKRQDGEQLETEGEQESDNESGESSEMNVHPCEDQHLSDAETLMSKEKEEEDEEEEGEEENEEGEEEGEEEEDTKEDGEEEGEEQSEEGPLSDVEQLEEEDMSEEGEEHESSEKSQQDQSEQHEEEEEERHQEGEILPSLPSECDSVYEDDVSELDELEEEEGEHDKDSNLSTYVIASIALDANAGVGEDEVSVVTEEEKTPDNENHHGDDHEEEECDERRE